MISAGAMRLLVGTAIVMLVSLAFGASLQWAAIRGVSYLVIGGLVIRE